MSHNTVRGARLSISSGGVAILFPGSSLERTSEVGGVDKIYKGGKFLKKLWCCVGGSITR